MYIQRRGIEKLRKPKDRESKVEVAYRDYRQREKKVEVAYRQRGKIKLR